VYSVRSLYRSDLNSTIEPTRPIPGRALLGELSHVFVLHFWVTCLGVK
jgi:hypothetical protein